MRKITEESIKAFYNEQNLKFGNTTVMSYGSVTYLVLFGHRIAKIDGQGLFVTTAGWDTSTTRDRLNGLNGVHVRSRGGHLTLNGHPWNGEWVNVEQFNLQNDERNN